MPSQELHDKIVETATSMFIQHGCRRITMDNIANELHISKRTLYEHFERKEDLLMDCFMYMKGLFDEKIHKQKLENESPVMMLLYIFKCLSVYSSKVSLLLTDVRNHYPEIYSQLFYSKAKIHAGHMGQALRKAKEMGDLRPNVNIEKAVEAISYIIKNIDTECPPSEALNTLSESAYTFVRGMLSINAIERFDQLETRIREELQKN